MKLNVLHHQQAQRRFMLVVGLSFCHHQSAFHFKTFCQMTTSVLLQEGDLCLWTSQISNKTLLHTLHQNMRYKNTYKHVWTATELLSRSENHPYSRPLRFMRYIRWCFLLTTEHFVLCVSRETMKILHQGQNHQSPQMMKILRGCDGLRCHQMLTSFRRKWCSASQRYIANWEIQIMEEFCLQEISLQLHT